MLLNLLKEILKSIASYYLNLTHPRFRGLYYSNDGVFLVYIESLGNYVCFLSLHNMSDKFLDKQVFINDILENKIKLVESLPYDVYKTCLAQYRKLDN